MARRTKLAQRIADLRREGYAEKQAVAIAYNEAREGGLGKAAQRQAGPAPRARRKNAATLMEGAEGGPAPLAPGAYRGYLVREHPVTSQVWIERGGHFIGYAPTVRAAREIVDMLAAGPNPPPRSKGRRRNPAELVVLGNPPGAARMVARHVEEIWYRARTHGGPRGAGYSHKFSPGAELWALEDGSVLIRNPRRRLWEDL